MRNNLPCFPAAVRPESCITVCFLPFSPSKLPYIPTLYMFCRVSFLECLESNLILQFIHLLNILRPKQCSGTRMNHTHRKRFAHICIFSINYYSLPSAAQHTTLHMFNYLTFGPECHKVDFNITRSLIILLHKRQQPEHCICQSN